MKEFSSQIDIAAKVKALTLPDKEKSLKKAEGASVRQQLMNTFEQVGGEEERFLSDVVEASSEGRWSIRHTHSDKRHQLWRIKR